MPDNIRAALRRFAAGKTELIAGAAAFMAAAALAAFLVYRGHHAAIMSETEAKLASIARLKVAELVNWRRERLGDAAALARNPLLAGAAGAAAAGSAPARSALTAHFSVLAAAKGYSAVQLLDGDGRVLAEAGDPHPVPAPELTELTQRLAAGEDPAFGDIIYCQRHGKTHLRLAARVSYGGRLPGLLLLRFEPEIYLFRLMQAWPAVSRTAETLLAEERGGRTLFLNELRHLRGTSGRFSTPLKPDLSAARSILGGRGFFYGRDYREERVYAYTMPVPGSRWHLVAKVDAAEVDDQAAGQLRLELAATFLLLLGGATAAAGVLRRRQRQAEERENRFLNALTDGGDTLVIFDLETRGMVYCGGACLKMYGYPIEEFRRLKADDLVPADRVAALAERFGRIAAAGRLLYRTEHRRRNGEVFPVEISAQAIELGGRACLHGVLRDISARALLEEQERLSRLRSEALLRLANAGGDESAFLDAAMEEAVAMTGSAIGYLYLYSEETKLFTLNSWSKEVMKACAVTEKQTVYELDKTGLWGEVVRQRKGLIVNDYSAPDPLKKGCPEGHTPLRRWLSVPVFEGGCITAVLGLANKAEDYGEADLDQTGLFMEGVWRMLLVRRAAARAHAAETSLEETAANVPGAIYRGLDDESRTMEYFSTGVGGLTGYRPEDFTGRRVAYASLVHPDDLPGLREKMAAAMGKGEPFQHIYRIRRADGRGAWVWEQGRLGRGGGGRLNGYIADVTELKESGLERERLNSELAAKNRELEDFLYVTTHDLRSPLVNIQGFGQNLRDHAALLRKHVEACPHGGGEVRDTVVNKIPAALRYISESAAKMDRLISALLRLSRLGRAALPRERVDMNALAEQVFNYFSFSVQQAGGTLGRGDLPPCLASKEMVNQLFSNLVDNALKYRHPDRPPAVTITGRQEGSRCVYEVRDNGVGIAPGELDRIWKVFYRLNPSVPGEGLGLALVRALAKKNGGGVAAESAPGEGSVFRVALPAVPDKEAK